MKRFELAIGGGGLTAGRAIRSYREAGGGGEIALLLTMQGDEPHPAAGHRDLRRHAESLRVTVAALEALDR